MELNVNDSLNDCLLEVSNMLDRLLNNQSENPELLNNIDNWIKIHFYKIQLSRNANDRVVIRSLENKKLREDALFIFDSSFNIISYSGSQNFFTGSNDSLSGTLCLLDIVDIREREQFKSLLANAINSGSTFTTELKIKTNINILNHCVFELDMAASNPRSNIYIAKLNFIEILASQLLEYQALILDSLPGMDIYLFDKNYNYLFAAGKEKERFKLNNLEMIGKSLFKALDKKAVRLIYPCITKALNGIENDGEIRYEGEVYYMKGTPVKDFSNESVGAILFSQNITNDKYLEEELNKSKEEALNADRLKSIFIANVSHEIRTPLNAIIGFTEQLSKTEVTAQQEKFINLIDKASDHLLYLVTEVVFLFKLGMGKVYIEKSFFCIQDLINEIEEIFKKQAMEKNLTLKICCETNFPGVILGDSFRLRQILMNLLSNALKYTDKGEVSLICRVKKETKKNIDLIFEIKDTGVGISKNNLESIFNVFEQGNKLNASFRGGAGLGLGICKNLVHLLGGSISVASKVKVGSTFTVVLPFEKTSASAKAPTKKVRYDITSNYSLLAGKKILLADDDQHNRILAQTILGKWDTEFTIVEDGQKAIELLDNIKYDVALIDIHMPIKNGIDVVRHIRSYNQGINFQTPILFMTANAIQSDISSYIKSGFDDYLIKPFREADFFNKICNVLSIDEAQDSSKMQMVEIKNLDMPYKDSFNTDDLWITANGDRLFFEKMVNNFISNSKNLVSVFTNEVASKNWNIVGESAHKAIPSFKYFALYNIANSLKLIENKILRELNYEVASYIIDNVITDINSVILQAENSLIVNK